MKPIGRTTSVFNFEVNKQRNKEGGMCRISIKTLIAFCVCIAWLAVPQRALSQTSATPSPCNNVASIGLDTFCDPAATIQITGQPVVPGQTVYYRATLTRGLGQCCVTGGVVTVTTPDGVMTVAGNVGAQLICNPGDNVIGSSAGTNFPVIAYTVREQDMGVQHGQFPCGFDAANSIQAQVTYLGGVNFCNGTCAATASTDNCNPVRTLALVVEKTVACTTGQVCDATSSYSSSASGAKDSNTDPKFCYRFIYRNNGTASLNVTSVVDNVLGSLTAPGGLAPGEVKTNFSGVTTHTSTANNTVIARAAQTSQSCYSTTLVAQSSATATVVDTPISCEIRFVRNGSLLTGKVNECTDCDVTVNPTANSIAVIVRVTNTSGNGQNIQNGTIKVGSLTFNVAGPITPGTFSDTTITNIPGSTVTACLSYTADVEFQGSITGACPPIDTTCNSSIRVCGTPNVCIVKLVKCMEDGSEEGECETQECTENLSLYSPSATGVKDAGFCYGIMITNCGQLELTSVVVNDSQLGNALPGFPTTLAVGQSATNFYPKSYPGFTGTIRNTATVSGNSAGGSVSANSNAVVNLLNPSIICTKQVSLDAGPYTSGGNIEVPFDSIHELTFRVIVRNNGSVDLANVKVIDTGVSGCGATTNIIASLPVGASVTNVLCTITEVTCPPPTTINNVVNVEAEVASNVCSINPADCQRVKTSSSCNNSITLSCTPPGACRTTGGGKQLTSEGQVCPTSDGTRYVTHGGQVGASFGVAGAPDCATDTGFNNPCIRGEYTHVRHMKGGLRGNFHAAGNGNQHDFDSLMCACLPCDHVDVSPCTPGCGNRPDRTYVASPTSPGKKHDLCNPGDRICGPEPRKAPANKICFSGVADYTMNKGKRNPQAVVFRVDIEDRGEPGNAHAIGASRKNKAIDRYRMRMWFIGEGTANTPAVKALRATVACKDATNEHIPCTLDCVGGATPAPNIDDGGDLDRGNRQIHPSTGAICR